MWGKKNKKRVTCLLLSSLPGFPRHVTLLRSTWMEKTPAMMWPYKPWRLLNVKALTRFDWSLAVLKNKEQKYCIMNFHKTPQFVFFCEVFCNKRYKLRLRVPVVLFFFLLPEGKLPSIAARIERAVVTYSGVYMRHILYLSSLFLCHCTVCSCVCFAP